MKRKYFYPATFILWLLSWFIIGSIIVYIYYPDTFKSTERIYYEPDTEQQQ